MPLNPQGFHRLDEATAEQWRVIMDDPANRGTSRADRFLVHLRAMAEHTDGFAVDELTHSLQTAIRAEQDGADPELVLAALLHDVGHRFGDENHGAVAAELLRPHVRTEVIEVVRWHTDFTSRHYAWCFDDDPDKRERHRDQPWFDLAERFADEWDQRSFDPDGPTSTLTHFEPLVRQLVVGG